jgi:hypothetical protein
MKEIGNAEVVKEIPKPESTEAEEIKIKPKGDISVEEANKIYEKFEKMFEADGKTDRINLDDWAERKPGERHDVNGAGETGEKEVKEEEGKKADTEVDKEDSANESEVEKKDPTLEEIEKLLSTPEGIKELMEKYPEEAEQWKSKIEELNDILSNPDATTQEKMSARAKLSTLKGQLLEYAVKYALSEAGLEVEEKQRVVEGESGGTRPDVIAKNNTDKPIEVFGNVIQPGENISVECKCGTNAYLTNELKTHIPNQLSGQEGTKILLTTSDVKDTPSGLADSVCDSYGAKLVVADVEVKDVEKAIEEVA